MYVETDDHKMRLGLKNEQKQKKSNFCPTYYENWSFLLSHEIVLLPTFHRNEAKIGDLSLMANFGSTLITYLSVS